MTTFVPRLSWMGMNRDRCLFLGIPSVHEGVAFIEDVHSTLPFEYLYTSRGLSVKTIR